MSSAAGAAPAQAHRYENLGDDEDDEEEDAPCPGTVDGDWPHHLCNSADPFAPAVWCRASPCEQRAGL
jgi:hypothetical protein